MSRQVQRSAPSSEIACAFRTSRQCDPGDRRVLPDVAPLLAGKKEELVLLDRAADGPAKIVITKLALARREEASRVEGIIAEEFPHAAVILVGPTAGYKIDGAA
jgi:hypothetical protein